MTPYDNPTSAKMTLTFLGTGTSTGVPMIGCNCHVCRSTDIRDKRLRTSALLHVAGKNILIDAGPDFRQQILRQGVDTLDCMLVTHSHYDHVGGIDDLRPFCYPNGFDVYTSEEVDANLRSHVPYCFAENPYPGAPVLHTHIVTPYVPFTASGIEIVPLAVNHYLMDILGFRIGNLGYITDAKVVPDATIEALQGVDTLVINALRITEHISHINLKEALQLISLINPRRAYLTHLSHDMGLHAVVEPMLPANVSIAYDTLTIEIP